MPRPALLALVLCVLAGCGVVSGAVGVVGTAASVTADIVETAADVATAPLR